jgi:hypothetical protein
VDQDCLARGEGGHAVERERRGEVVHGDRGRLRIAENVRKVEDLFGGDRDHVGITAEARQRDDAVAVMKAGHGRANAVDLPRNLVADDTRRFRGIGIEAEPGEHVGEIDARSPDPDPHFSGARGRIRSLPQIQNVWRPMARYDDLPHR